MDFVDDLRDMQDTIGDLSRYGQMALQITEQTASTASVNSTSFVDVLTVDLNYKFDRYIQIFVVGSVNGTCTLRVYDKTDSSELYKQEVTNGDYHSFTLFWVGSVESGERTIAFQVSGTSVDLKDVKLTGVAFVG